MKPKEYANTLNKLAEQYPELTVVHTIDSEGLVYQKVNFEPTLGFYQFRQNKFCRRRTVRR
ncbi:MAG TPA: hypothetical protein VNI84_03325 [Pyrinomonadaceae bacterium]|nr:hypothetical protein [Pyrinomonadaceae bacterium]